MMVEDIKYKVSKDLINKISTAVDENPKITDEDLFKTFPDLNNDAKFLKAIGEYKATKDKYKDEKIVDAKFPEFDFVTVQGPTNEGSSPDTAYTVSIPEGATVSAEKEDPIAKDNIARNNWLTYIADQALSGGVKGIANTAAAAQDFKEFIAGKMMGTPVIEAGGMMLPIDEKAKTAIKQGVAADIEKAAETVGGISTKEYKEKVRKNTEENLFTWDVIPVGVGMVADVIAQNAPTGGAGMYTTMFESAKNDALAKGLNEDQAFAYGSTIGLAVGAISHYGINKMLKGLPKSAQDKVTRYIADKALDNISKTGKNITPEIIQDEISSVAKSYAGKVASMGTKAAYNAATQGTAMGGIEGVMYGTEQATNKILGKEIFKTPDVKMRFAKALVNGAVGGFAVGGVTGAFTKEATDNYINKKIQETIKDDNQYNEFRTQLVNDLTKNKFNEPDVQSILEGIDLKRSRLKAIPEAVSPKAQLAVLNILDIRDKLKRESDALNAENVDPAFKSDIETKKVIIEDKIKATEDSAKAVNDGAEIVYRATENGFEKEVNGKVEPITEEQFDYANESKLDGIKIENKNQFTYYERDGKYFKKFGEEGKEQPITKTTYDFETKKIIEEVKEDETQQDKNLEKGITVYHGSPYAYDKFDLAKIGSGEGAQAFGHGLYFTNKKEIAESYANNLSSRKKFWEYLMNGNDISLSKEDFNFINKELDALGFDGETAESEGLTNIIVDGNPESGSNVLEALAVLFGKNAKSALDDYGLTDSEINRLLEIKKRISDPQLYKVKLHSEKNKSEFDYLSWEKDINPKQAAKIEDANIPGNIILGQDIYRFLSKKLGGDKKASEYLLSKQIDGIEYKSNKGTGGVDGNGVNYVVFDPRSISIEEINNKPKEDATKTGTEPIEPQGGEQGNQQQYPRAEEGQPQVGEPEGGAGETTQPEANRSDSNIGSEARKQEINAKFVEAQNLYSEMMDVEGAAKKRSINKQRQKMLDENPSIKFVLENMKALEEALGDRLKKSGDCP